MMEPMEEERAWLVTLGAVIARHRRVRGYSSHLLSQRAAMSDPYLRKIEQGKSERLGIEVLARIAAALETTVDVLLAEAGIPTTAQAADEVSRLFAGLDLMTRKAALENLRTLARLQAANTEQRESELHDLLGRAAYDRLDVAQTIRREIRKGQTGD